MKKTNIFLIGPMGSGKTSVGKQLAKLTHFTYYDSDHEIQSITGVTISWIFEKEGEVGFRQREEEMIAELTQLDNVIIATGGGSILHEVNRKNLHENGTVVYLKASLTTQLKRTARRKGGRPLVENAADPEEVLTKLNEQREPLYNEIADLTYNTDKLQPQSIAKKILKDMEKQSG